MALAILLAAAGLAWWSSQRSAAQERDIHDALINICRDQKAALDQFEIDPAVEEFVRTAIDEACASGGTSARLQIEVAAGDGTATHTAMLIVDGRHALGLRLRHQGRGRPIVILGYWRP